VIKITKRTAGFYVVTSGDDRVLITNVLGGGWTCRYAGSALNADGYPEMKHFRLLRDAKEWAHDALAEYA
jgi:hypothetical protein